jgi:hypothetical protein
MDAMEKDVVLVPVRVDQLQAVLKARDGEIVGADHADTAREERLYGSHKDWTGAELERLYALSKPTLRLVFGHLAHHPEQRVTTWQLADVVYGEGKDPDFRRIRGVLNGLTRHAQRVRGKENGVWPIFYDPHGETGGFEYWMDHATAEKFREIERSFRT